MWRLMVLLLAVGCTYPEEDFLDDFDRESCAWQTDCYDYQDEQTCLSEAEASRSELPDTCTYDPKAARECVRDYAAIDCPDGVEYVATIPVACEGVWNCD